MDTSEQPIQNMAVAYSADPSNAAWLAEGWREREDGGAYGQHNGGGRRQDAGAKRGDAEQDMPDAEHR